MKRCSRPMACSPCDGRAICLTRLQPMPTLRPLVPNPLASAEAASSAAPCSSTPGKPANPQKYLVTVGASAIDGQGAFAGEAIPARAKIGEVRGEFIDLKQARARAREAERNTGRIFMIAISDKRAVDATASSDALRFANHSCAPNALLKVQQGRVAFYALHDIEAGQELTVDYGVTHHAGRLRCACGAANCRGQL